MNEILNVLQDVHHHAHSMNRDPSTVRVLVRT
jgi:hypothetical protein